MSASLLADLVCPACGASYDADMVANLCACGSPLYARYDLDTGRRMLSPREIATRPPGIWRYHELLPVRRETAVVTLGEGSTPLIHASRLGAHTGLPNLHIKDEGRNPTGTFKARGASVCISRYWELKVDDLAVCSAGNAAAALAAYSARAGLAMHVVLPATSSGIARRECAVFGAKTYAIDGDANDAYAALHRGLEQNHWFDVSPMFEPYRLEGKKTMGYELAEQLGWRLPDVIVYPVGAGVGFVGMWKAFDELESLGWIDGRRPRMFAVQPSGCAPIVTAFREGQGVRRWQTPRSIASGLLEPEPVAGHLVLDIIARSGGLAVSATDDEILDALHDVAECEGLFISPEGAATIAAARRLAREGALREDDHVVAFNTAMGVRYSDLVKESAPVFRPDERLAQRDRSQSRAGPCCQ